MTDPLAAALLDKLDAGALLERLADADPAALERFAHRIDELRGRRDDVMDRRPAAAYLGLTPDALYKRTQSGEVPSAQDRPGCRLFYRRSDLDRWLDDRRRGAAA